MVAGFPSNIAALQFEWAWQNAHLTRHIPHDERISFAASRIKTSPKSKRTRRRPGKPKSSLTERLSNLHLLLRVPYFSNWPLELRFFSEDVFQFWQTWCQRVDAQISPRIKVWLDKPKESGDSIGEIDLEATRKQRKLDMIGKGGVEGVDPTYASLRPVLERGHMILEDDEMLSCSLCDRSLTPTRDFITICPQADCQSCHHMVCLSNHFLDAGSTSSIVPTGGHCPDCNTRLSWAELMKEMTLRVRGEKEVLKLLKRKRPATASAGVAAGTLDDENSDDSEVDQLEGDPLTAADVVDEDGDDNASVTSMDSELSCTSARRVIFRTAPDVKLSTVIEDSDGDVIDLLSD